MSKNLPQKGGENQEITLELAEAALLLGTTPRTLQRQIKSGKLAAVTAPSRGGNGGMKYLVPLSSLPPSKQAEYLKSKGIVEDQQQTSVVGRANPASPAPLSGAGPAGRVNDSLPAWAETTALARADLLHAWEKYKPSTLPTSGGGGREAGVGVQLDAFLAAYNSGVLLPALFKALGPVSRGTLYRWERQYADSGRDYTALAPAWGGHNKGKSKVTDDEKNILLTQLLHQHQLKVHTAITNTKAVLRMRGIPSPSSERTLARFAKEFEAQNYDKWVLAREGEKALNDKVLPYIKRDSSLLSVGDVLVADGHRMNFQVINPYTGRPCRPTMLGFFDWASRDLCGW